MPYTVCPCIHTCQNQFLNQLRYLEQKLLKLNNLHAYTNTDFSM
jgi:hypothetical protein